MTSYRVSPLIFLFTLFSICNVHHIFAQNNSFIITDFGAIADCKTDNKQAFLDAWEKACETIGGLVSVPNGNFFLSSGDFEGPCNGHTFFNINGTLMASHDPTLANDQDYWLTFSRVDNFTISGHGVLDGNGPFAWSRCRDASANCTRPVTLKINHATNALIEDITLLNSKMFHLNIQSSTNITMNNLTITAPKDSPNTDGVHLGRSTAVTVHDSRIATGDDCVSIGDGNANINISGIHCGPGHGISIGSLGQTSGQTGVTGVTVRNCTLRNTGNGLRIKTWALNLSPIVVSNVVFSDINLDHVDNPIIIDQYYCPDGRCSHGGESSVQIDGVKYVDVTGSSLTETAIKFECSKSRWCKDIELVGVDITFDGKPTMARCSSVENRFQGTNQVPSSCS